MVIGVEPLNVCEIDRLPPLVEDFVRAHSSLPIRPDYIGASLNWLRDKANDPNTIVYLARHSTDICGLSVGTIETNAPLMLPEKIGYVQALVGSSSYRREGIGKVLWNRTKEWFISKGINEVQLYTAVHNNRARAFWQSCNFDVFYERRKTII